MKRLVRGCCTVNQSKLKMEKVGEFQTFVNFYSIAWNPSGGDIGWEEGSMKKDKTYWKKCVEMVKVHLNEG